ncbi:hypothetical protein CNMCM6457_007487 [Aspergillus fumigatiaffinis]|nr:hypothetical protein CNMCM6457_007487 [Aspergillus fumigatiaffinis]
MGWSVHSVDFPYKVGHPLSPTWPQIWEVRHSAKGAWPTGDPTDPRFSPAPRRAVTPVRALLGRSKAARALGACPGALSVPLLPYFTVFVAAAGLLGTLAPPSGAAAP